MRVFMTAWTMVAVLVVHVTLAPSPRVAAQENTGQEAKGVKEDASEQKLKQGGYNLRRRSSSRRTRPSPPPENHSQGQIQSGRIPVLDILRVLGATTGNQVIYPSVAADSQYFGPDAMIDVLSDSDHLSLDLLCTYLEANGYVIYEHSLPDGTNVFRVGHRRDRGGPGSLPAGDVFAANTPIPPGGDIRPCTATVHLSHASSRACVLIMRDIFGVGAFSASFLQIPGTNSLIVRGLRRDVRHALDMLSHVEQASASNPTDETKPKPGPTPK